MWWRCARCGKFVAYSFSTVCFVGLSCVSLIPFFTQCVQVLWPIIAERRLIFFSFFFFYRKSRNINNNNKTARNIHRYFVVSYLLRPFFRIYHIIIRFFRRYYFFFFFNYVVHVCLLLASRNQPFVRSDNDFCVAHSRHTGWGTCLATITTRLLKVRVFWWRQ